MSEVPLYGMPDMSSETGYEFGYGYWLPPYGTAYRRALQNYPYPAPAGRGSAGRCRSSRAGTPAREPMSQSRLDSGLDLSHFSDKCREKL